MNGNGCDGSIESGVSTGKISCRKVCSIAARSAFERSAASTMTMPFSESSLRSSRSCSCCFDASFAVSETISISCSAGESPSGLGVVTPSRTCPLRPAARTMKNSSRFAAEIERKRSRSSSGCFSFSASSSTRRLKLSQESSRLMKRSGLPRSSKASGETAGVLASAIGRSAGDLNSRFIYASAPFQRLNAIIGRIHENYMTVNCAIITRR